MKKYLISLMDFITLKKSRKKVNFTKIRVKVILITSFLFIGIIPLTVVAYFTYQGARDTIEHKIGFYSNAIVEQVADKVDNKLTEIIKSSNIIISDIEINNILSKDHGNSFDEMMARNKIAEKIGSISYSNTDISSIIIFNQNIKNVYSDIDSSTTDQILGENFENNEIYQGVKEAGGKPVWVTGIKNNYDKIFMMRKLNGLTNGNDNGVLVYIINSDVFSNIINGAEFGEDSRVQLFTENKTVITALNKEMIGERYQGYINMEEDNGYQSNNDMLTAYATTINGWRLSSIIPMQTLLGDIYQLGEKTIILAIICVLFAVIMGIYISLGISNPLHKIINLMKRVESGDLNVSSDFNGKNEMGSLAKSFNKMVINIKELINNTSHTSNMVLKDTAVINDVSSQSYTSAQQVSESIESISVGAQEQADVAEKSTELMELLAERINSVNDYINSVLDMASDIKITSNNAGKTVNILSEKSNITAEMSNSIKDDINTLNSKAREISKIVDLIDGISEQTIIKCFNRGSTCRYCG